MTTDLELDARIADALNRAAGTAEIDHASSRSKIASAAAETRRSRRDPRHVARGWIATVRPITIMTASLIGVAVIGGGMIMNSRNNSNEHPAASEQPSTFQPSGTEFPISPTATALGPMFVVKPGTASTVSIPGHPDLTSYISVAEVGGHVREFHCFQSGGGGSCNSAWWSASTTTTSTVNNGLGDFDVWAWGDVPPNAAFVTWTAGSTTLWQRPVAGIAAFPFQRGDGDIVRVAVALDANGNEIARTDGTFSGFGDNPNPDAGLVSNLDRSDTSELGNLAQTSMASCLLANGDSSWDLCLTEADQAVQSRFVELGGKLVAPPAADPTQPADTTSESPTNTHDDG